jgi:hypothetical protein
VSDDPLWYQDAVFYELHVKAFQDSNGDGIGDFNGLIQRLDYVQALGVDVIWLLPYYPPPCVTTATRCVQVVQASLALTRVDRRGSKLGSLLGRRRFKKNLTAFSAWGVPHRVSEGRERWGGELGKTGDRRGSVVAEWCPVLGVRSI